MISQLKFKNKEKRLILAIETSCDETAVSIISIDKKNNITLLSNIVSSQVKKHAPFGGVVPTLAKREHQKNLTKIALMAIKKAGLKETRGKNDFDFKKIEKILEKDLSMAPKIAGLIKKYPQSPVDLICVTYGPGLAPALWPGINFSRALSYAWKIPIKPINHLEGHFWANWIPEINQTINVLKETKNIFPAISLIISGGHTQIVLVKNKNDFKVIGETRDDAAGECFDKSSRLLGLGYPGGPAISLAAKKFEERKSTRKKIELPRPMINSGDFDFSFSGLKTAVLRLTENLSKKQIEKQKNQMAWEIQNSIAEVLAKKTIKAAEKFKVKSIVLGGGVSANEKIKKIIAEEIKNKNLKFEFFSPQPKNSTDNAAMIAITASLKPFPKNKNGWKKIKADSNLGF